MNKVVIFIVGLMVVVISILAIHGFVQPKPFKWMESYHPFDKQPYGSYVFYNQLDNLFPNKFVKQANSSIFDYLGKYDYYFSVDSIDYTEDLSDWYYNPFNFIGVGSYFSITDFDSRLLLMHLHQGNNALIAAEYVNGDFLAELGISTDVIYVEDTTYMQTMVHNQEKFTVQFYDQDWVDIKPVASSAHIVKYPKGSRIIAKNEEGDILGIELEVGKGRLTYLTIPLIFTNYFILKTDPNTTEEFLLNLPNEDTYWAYGSWSEDPTPVESPGLLSFIHSQESLKWAFYVLLFSVLLFFFFEIKRRQRAVQVIKPTENVSLKFSASISQLYLLRRDNREMVKRKMTYLLDHIRNDLGIATNEINEAFYKRLAQKTNIKEGSIRRLFTLYFAYQARHEVTEDEFIKFNRLVQLFKTK